MRPIFTSVRRWILLSLLLLGGIYSQAQTITVTSPNGGEVLPGCTQYTVTWTTSGSVSNFFNVDFSINGGVTWSAVATNFQALGRTFSWTVPNVNTTNALVRVMDAQNTVVRDQSNSPFSITAPMVLNSPNGGQVWQGQSTQTISWAATSGGSGTYNLEYSTDAGSSWTSIINNFTTASNTYTWTVPNIPTTTALVRVTDAGFPCRTDFSDNVFTITAAPSSLNITNPTNGMTWFAGQVINVSWTNANLPSNFIRIDYSFDNGLTWNLVAASTPTNATAGSFNWTLPNTPTTQARVRLRHITDTTISTISQPFTIRPFVVITSPAPGAQLAACNNTSIIWGRGGTSNSWNIDYSINGGQTWIPIANNHISNSATSVSFSWSVPNTPGTSVMLRVTDASDLTKRDTSDSFTIIGDQSIIVNSPNGGEVWQGGTNRVISWASQTTSSTLELLYSINNGQSWSSITTISSAFNQYNWLVPNTPGTQALVRVRDWSNTCKVDQSDSLFVITAATPTISLTNPTSSVNWYAGQLQTISWSHQFFPANSFVRLEYSTDGGANWQTIVNSAPAGTSSGSFNWTVPNEPTNQARVRVSLVGNPSISSTSPVNFTLLPFVVLASPTTSVNWAACTNQTISWNRGGTSNLWRIEYSLDGGANWILITSNFSTSSSTFLSYTWSVPNRPTNALRIRVRDAADAQKSDSSRVNGTIVRDQSVIINTPNGGQVWQASTTQQASWATNNVSSTLELSYSTDAGQSWNSITTVSSFNNTYNWTIPNTPTTNALFRVRDWNNTCKADTSDNVFTISAPNASISLSSPTSAVTWYAGQTQTISWNCNFLPSSFVRLEYSTDGGNTWQVIVNSTPTNSTFGSYSWIVPNTPTNQARVRVSPVGSPSIQSTSPVNFTILPFVVLNSPNGGQTLTGCNTQTISWSRGGTSNNWRLEYSTDNGQTWQLIVNNLSSSSSTNLSYTWAVPNVPSTSVLVRISDALDNSKNDVSDAVFTILRDQSIVLNSPNGGEVWQGGTNRQVSWATQNVSSTLEMSYSTDLGQNWNTITTISSSANQYTWGVPNAPGSNNLFRVRDWNNTCKQDISDAPFTITAANQSFTITNPTTNVSWYAGQLQTISWSNQFIPTNSFVKLEYSIDGGANWITIVNAAPAGTSSGSFNWTVPNAPTNQARVKISLVGNSAIQAVNPVNFTLLPFVVLTSPTGNQTWPACETRIITFSRGGTSNQFNFAYSTDSGATWIPIANNVSFGSTTSLSYSWVVNNTPSTGVRYRVTDSFDPLKADSSRSNNTITLNQSIVINTPNGGESWKGNTVQQVSWAANNVSSTLELSYSTNGGQSWSTITNLSSFNNTYNWTIPNTPTTTALFRIRDFNNTCKRDFSDSLFEITPPDPILTLTSFNNGATVFAGQTQSINWSNQFLPNNNIRIEYSIDNGSSWITVTNSTPTNNTSGNFTWTIPNTPTRFGLVRISVVGNSGIQSTSTQTFIIQPFVVLNAPVGGENWSACTNRTISWNRGGTSSQWRIEYSLNGGQSWNLITNNHFGTTSVTQNYTWAVPNLPSNTVRIRVSDALDLSKSDSSRSDFTLLQDQSIIVNSPNGGEIWTGGTSRVVSWASTGTSSTLSLQYSIDNGQNWSSITNVSAFTNQFTWNIPNTPSTTAVFRVSDVNNTCKNDVSDATFTILPAVPTFNLSTPNGGEILYVGAVQTISWTSQFTPSSFVRLEYSVDNGNSWQTIVNATSNSGSFNWTVPNTVTNQALVRISDFTNSGILDVSNSVFSIQPPIRILTPNGGEKLFGCAQTTISFNRGGASNFFRIEYSIDNGQNWTFVANLTSSANPASYTWTLPAIGSASYLVRVMDQNNNARVDVSDSAFTVYAPITITDPNTGGQWQANTTRLITWTDTLTSKNYNIDYSLNGGTTWTNIVVNQFIPNGQYLWTVPNVTTSNGLIRITEFGSSCKQDVSNFPFTITQTTNSLTVTSPNGGAQYLACQVLPITWTSQGLTGTIRIEVSYNNGLTWTMIDGAVPVANGSYNWTVPNTASGLFLVRLTSNIIAVINDVSNGPSTLLTPVAQAGANLFVCQGDSVTLMGSGTGTYSWSPATGLSSTTVANPKASPSTTTTYTLTLTNSFGCTSTDQVLVTVAPKPNLVLTGDTVICAGNSTQLQATGASSYNWTPVTGINNANSSSPIFSPASSTNYRLIGTNNGCRDTAFVRIVVNPSPATPSITALGATTFCQGDSVFLSSSATSGNQWFRNGQPIVGETGGILTVKSSGSYAVRVSNGNCTASSNVIAVVVNAVPSIPQISSSGNLQFCSGGSVTLTSSSLTGNTWLRNNVVIAGATAQTLVATAAGTYTVRVSNGQCNALSAGVSVVVTPALPTPTISASGATTFCSVDSVVLTASDNLGSWRWLRNGNVLTDDTSRTLTVRTSGSYAIRIERGGCSATSVAINIVVNPSPTIPTIAASGSLAFCQGDSVTLSSSLSAGLQWFNNGNPINGANGSSLVVKTSGNYTLRQTLAGCSATSVPTAVTVNAIPTVPVLTPGFDQTLCNGQSVTLRTIGSFQQYQWQNNQTDISGAQADSLLVTTSGNYRLVVTNTAGCSNTSEDVAITFQSLPITPAISSQGPLSFCVGNATILSSAGVNVHWYRNGLALNVIADTLLVTTSGDYTARNVGANGCFSESNLLTVQVNPLPAVPLINASGALTQCEGNTLRLSTSTAVEGAQWLVNGQPLLGANDTVLVVNTSGSYQLSSTNSFGCESLSQPIAVTFHPVPTPATITGSGALSFCQGGQAILRTTGASGNRQWLLDGQPLLSAQSDTIIANQTGTYQLQLTNAFGCSSLSNSLSVVVNPVPAAPVNLTGNVAICDGESTLLRVNAGNGTLQWLRNGNIIPGANSDSLLVNLAGSYRVRLTNSSGCTALSSFQTVTVNANPASATLTAMGNASVCQGELVVINATGATGTKTWLKDGQPFGTSNADSLVAGISGNYQLKVTNASGCSSLSNAIAVVIHPLPTLPAVIPSGATTLCQGDSIRLNSSYNNGNQWLLNGQALTNQQTDSLWLTATGNYSVRYTDANGCSATSAAISVQVNTYPLAATLTALGNTTFCVGSGVALKAAYTDGDAQWTFNGSPISGATGDSLFATQAGTYSLILSRNGLCAVNSLNDVLTQTLPTPNQPQITASHALSFCQGDSVVLSSTGLANYQWLKNGQTIVGANDSLLVVRDSGNYSVSTQNGICDRVSNDVSVNVFAIPATPAITPQGSTTLCQGDSVLLRVSYQAQTIKWYRDGQQIANNSDSLWVNAAGTYEAEAINGGLCASQSNPIAITVNPVPAIPAISSGNTTICQGDSVTLTTTAQGNLQWFRDGLPILGAQASSYQATQSGDYRLQISSLSGCSNTSNTISVTVNVKPAIPTLNLSGIISSCQNDGLVLRATTTDSIQWFRDGQLIAAGADSVEIILSGLYQAIAVTPQGCGTASDTVRIFVNPLPTVPNISRTGNLRFCQGGRVVFRVNNLAGFGLQWLKDGQPIAGQTADSLVAISAGFYQLRVENAGGCKSLSTGDTVQVDALPAQPSLTPSGPVSLCQGQSILLLTNAATNRQWFRDGQPIAGQTADSLRVSTTGQYTVRSTNASGCLSNSNPVAVTIHPLPAVPTITATGSTTFCSGSQVVLRSSAIAGNQWLLNGNPIAGQTADSLVATQAGTYTVQVTNANNCSSTSAGITTTVNPTPPVALIGASGPTTFCQGGQVSLSSSITQNATWVLNGQPFAAVGAPLPVVSSGSWVVRVSGGNGCFSFSAPTVITVNPIPLKPVISRVADTLISNAISGNQWILVGSGPVAGANQSRFQPTQSGNYTVQVTANGCSSPNADTISFFFTSVVEASHSWTTQLYPNPASDQLTLALETSEPLELDASILDSRGRLFRRWEIQGLGQGRQQVKVQIEGLADGIYFLRLTNPANGQTHSQRFIIRK